MMISSMLVFARNFLGTLLREATRVCPSPKCQAASFSEGLENVFCVLCIKDFLETETRRALALASEAETRRAAGRGNSTERVTEGEQGKNWRNGARTEIVRKLGRLPKTHFRKPPR